MELTVFPPYIDLLADGKGLAALTPALSLWPRISALRVSGCGRSGLAAFARWGDRRRWCPVVWGA